MEMQLAEASWRSIPSAVPTEVTAPRFHMYSMAYAKALKNKCTDRKGIQASQGRESVEAARVICCGEALAPVCKEPENALEGGEAIEQTRIRRLLPPPTTVQWTRRTPRCESWRHAMGRTTGRGSRSRRPAPSARASRRARKPAAAIRDRALGLDGFPHAWWACAPPLAHELLYDIADGMQDGGDTPALLRRSVMGTISKAEVLEEAEVARFSADTARP